MPTKKTYSIMVISFLIIIAGSIYFSGEITGMFGWFEKSESQNLNECIKTCEEMYSKLVMIVPETEEYNAQIEKINIQSEQCLTLNEAEENPLKESEILESCGYVNGTLGSAEDGCVPAGETIYLEKEESCEEGIQRCCSGFGLCGKDQLSVPDHVVCLPY